jgi:hypothetical protein
MDPFLILYFFTKRIYILSLIRYKAFAILFPFFIRPEKSFEQRYKGRSELLSNITEYQELKEEGELE